MSEPYKIHWKTNVEELTLTIEQFEDGDFYWLLFSNKRLRALLGREPSFNAALSNGTAAATKFEFERGN